MFEKTSERWGLQREEIDMLVKLLERRDGQLLLEMLESLVKPFQESLLRSSDMATMFRNQGAAFLYDLFKWKLEEFKADVKAEVDGEFEKRHAFDPIEKFKEAFE